MSCPQFDKQVDVIIRPADAMRMAIEVVHNSTQITMEIRTPRRRDAWLAALRREYEVMVQTQEGRRHA